MLFHHSDNIPFNEVSIVTPHITLNDVIDLYNILGKAYHLAEKQYENENGDTAEYWRKRYEDLQGAWTEEVSSLRSTIQNLNEQIVALKFPDGLVKAALSNYDIVRAAFEGRKIESIKDLRHLTGCGLLAAKNAIESQEFLDNYEAAYKTLSAVENFKNQENK